MSGTPSTIDEFSPTAYHPWIPAGANATPVCGDVVNGSGVNAERYPPMWDEIVTSSPSVMAGAGNTTSGLPEDAGQTVDLWVQKEKRVLVLARDLNKVKAAGFRGHLDEHP